MKKIIAKVVFLILIGMFPLSILNADPREESVYIVKRLKERMEIDGDWNKPQWRYADIIRIDNYMGKIPEFRPRAMAKMLYDNDNVYLIFKVDDRYVHSVIETYNGPVSTDACVEFFFLPDTNLPLHYFNLEINAGGTPLMAHHIFSQKEYHKFTDKDLAKIEIAHSLPKKVDPEITQAVTWTVEYKLPIVLLEKYSSVSRPKANTTWKANFYKTASQGSNPHWITWSVVENEKPSFHLPQFFGQLQFQ